MSNAIETKLVFKTLIYLSTLIPALALAQTTDHHNHHLQLARLSQWENTSTTETNSESSVQIIRKQAWELLGKASRKNPFIKKGEKLISMNQYIYEWTERELRPSWKKQARKVAEAIMLESKKHSFDPVLLMAVIENESSFNPEVIGNFGEIGLMQITPQTAEWISKKYHIAYRGPKTLKNPVVNITIGSAYLAYLREKFGRKGELYLAAYNMGSRNVQRFLASQHELPKQYPTRVTQRYVGFYKKFSQHPHLDQALAMN